MIWIFVILQMIFIQIGWWVYAVYFTQPAHNHPSIFWNHTARRLLEYGPAAGIIGLVIASFVYTNHPWPFLVFTLIWMGYRGHKQKASSGHIMPVLTEDGIKLESLSTEELLADIRRHKQETAPNNNKNTEES